MGDPRWCAWSRRTLPYAAVAVLVGWIALPSHEGRTVISAVILAALVPVACLVCTEGQVPWWTLAAWTAWLTALLGWSVWSLPAGIALAGVVLATTPWATRLRHRGDREVAGLSDRALLGEWSRTRRVLQTWPPQQALPVVARRAALLEEIERRGLLEHCL
jgi:hypothetical protein